MNERSPQGRHNIILENRSKLFLTGITEVERFDENELRLVTELGRLRVTGSRMHIGDMSVESGEVTIEGTICSVCYDSKKAGKSVFRKLKG